MLFGRKNKLPWLEEGKRVFGMHESHDRRELQSWLRSDGTNLGDPRQLPWCGDYVETAIKNSLPDEPFPGPLGENPYWARNWLYFGEKVRPCYGAVLVFERGNGGHVGFAVGEDATDFYVLGGNQSNMVCISRITKSRYLGARWPTTHPNPKINLPILRPDRIPRTTNEF